METMKIPNTSSKLILAALDRPSLLYQILALVTCGFTLVLVTLMFALIIIPTTQRSQVVQGNKETSSIYPMGQVT